MHSIQVPLPHCPEGRYTKVPDAILSDLTPREHQLVHLLLSYRWYEDSPIYPYVGTMATRLGCSKRTIQRTLRSLEAKDYLIVAARYRDLSEDDEHHGQTSNLYAPGPRLLALLPRSVDDGDGTASRERRHPMTPMPTGRRDTNQRSYARQKNAVAYEASDYYYQTREGVLPRRR